MLRFSKISSYFTFENLTRNKMLLQQYLDKNYLLFVIIYIISYFIITGTSIPGATIMTLAGGFLFGTILAAVYVNIGATLGATSAFLLSRYFMGNWIQNKYKERLKNFNKEVELNGYRYLLAMRFIPAFPFWMVNLFAGITKIHLKTFIWTTLLGIIPGSLVYSYAGSRINYIESTKDIFSKEILFAFLLLGLFSVMPIIIKKIRKLKSV